MTTGVNKVNRQPGMIVTYTPNERAAAQIRGYMAARKKHAYELAAELEVSTYTANRRMQGIGDFTLDEIEKVAKWLGVPIMHIVDPSPDVKYTP